MLLNNDKTKYFQIKNMRFHVHTAILLELLVGVIVSVLSLVSFIWLTETVLSSQFQFIDEQIGAYVFSLRTPLLTNIMMVISYFGSEFVILFVLCITAYMLFKHRNREASFVLFVFGMGVIINLLLKELIHRPRPALSPLIALTSYSFPSAHAMNSFIFYTLLTYVFFTFSNKLYARIIVILTSCFLILIIGISRVYLGVHYPTDIIGGYIGGLWVVITAFLINKTLKVF